MAARRAKGGPSLPTLPGPAVGPITGGASHQSSPSSPACIIPRASCITDGSAGCGGIGTIYLGSMAAAHDLEPLQRAGITHIVDLTVPGFDANEGAPNHRGIEYMHIRVKDQPGENLGQHLKRAGDFIQRAHGAGGGVLVHCLHGKSRSSAVVIAYLLLHHGMTLSGALAFCKKRRSKVAPNIGFVLQLSALEQATSGVSTLDPDVYAADQLWCQVQLGYIQAATGPLKLHHCAEAVKRHPPSNPAHGGLLGAMEWLEKLDPATVPEPCEPEPEPAQAPRWGEPGWDPTSPAITAVAGPAAAAASGSGGGGGATSESGRRLHPHTLEALWSDQR